MTSQSPSSRSFVQAAAAGGWLGPWLALGALSLWTADPGTGLLAVAAVGVAVASLWGRPGRSGAAGLAVLLLGILAGFEADRQIRHVETEWDSYWLGRVDWVGQRLNQALDDHLRAGEEAADGLARLVTGEPGDTVDPRRLWEIRRTTNASAMALYGPDGGLVVWDGDHRGKVPEEVQSGGLRYVYREMPLFGYLYVTAPTAGGGVAMAAFLLTTDLPPRLAADMGDFATRFHGQVGEQVRIVERAPPWSQGVWDLELPDRQLLSVVLDQPDPVVRRAELLDRWRGWVGLLVVLSWVLLAAGGPPRLAAGGVASAGLVFLAATLPISLLGPLSSLFPVAGAGSAGPLGLGVGRFALIVFASVTVIAILPRPRFRIPHWGAGAIAGLLFPLLVSWLAGAVPVAAVAEGNLGWVVFQASLATLLTLLTGSLLVFTASRPASPWLAVLAAASAGLLGAGGAAFVWQAVSPPEWWPAVMAVPVAIAARSLGAWSGWQRPVARWSLSVIIAGAATIPSAWGDRIEARMALGAERLEQLAAEDDPRLEEVLRNLGRVATTLDAAEADPDEAEFLYSVWRESGLAALGSPAWLTLWSASGIPGEELDVGVGARPVVAGAHLDEPDGEISVRLLRYDRDDARYVLRVPLSGGRMLTVVAPPIGDLGLSSPLRALLGSGTAVADEPLTLIPLIPGDERERVALRWVPIEGGWQGELPLTYMNALYHAHYAIPLPSTVLAAARATLLLLFNFVCFLAFWIVGRALIHEALPAEARWAGFAVSFRSRVTLALFGFFLLANALFGTLAYRTLNGASHRAARVLAERVVEDAASFYLEVSGSMDLLAGRVGSELLEYRDGELREGSVEALVELGLYEGWTPFEIRRRLDGREGLREFTEMSLGEWEYGTASRRLPDGDILAAQVPLQAGATAIRTRDLVELLGFAVVLGGLLSLGLAFLVGRALTQPIHELQIASERVGGGNLDLRLKEGRKDEFGSVFRAFNRMVRRIRRARRQQVRTARRTQAIMEEAAVGMIALDPEANVTLVNPRAEAVLEAPVPVGTPLSVPNELGTALAKWMEEFLAGRRDEGGTEVHGGERRVRVRARRLGQKPAAGGVVISLEDVTDELRTERVLAWGEMARQVAHEVKNPLTPIKLSVQHLRRAWDDRPADFDAILSRNAEAILREIDRLAAIAQSFSRFGAPSVTEEEPLGAVVLPEVVGEVMDLYSATDGPVVFESDLAIDLPAVRARPAQVKEVLVNLLENARAGIGDAPGRVVVAGRANADGRVDLEVIDDGVGIPEDLLPRVLEPHLSTRVAGTGLGLAIVQRLVESWGGGVTIESREGEGTRVRLHLLTWRP